MSRLSAAVVRRPVAVVLLWLVVIGGLTVTVPRLETVIAHDPTAFVPPDAPSIEAFTRMDEDFDTGRSQSIVVVAVEREGGLTRADRSFVQRTARELRADGRNVGGVTDLSTRGVLASLTSRDGESVYFNVGVPGATGAPPTARQIEAVRSVVHEDPPTGLDVAVTGPAASIADVQGTIEHDIARITIITIGLIGLILLVIYRSVAVTALVLSFIGAALALGRAVTAWAGDGGVFHVSTFTASFLTAVVLGAATDYAVFLVSRYQELRRSGLVAREAVAAATAKVASVIVASALTVVLATAAMLLARIGLFNTTGPAVALGVAATLLLCLTLLPALMALVAPRGWIDPRTAVGEQRWRRTAGYVVSRPARVLALGLLPLVALASLYPLLAASYDQAGVQPDDTESNRGYRMIAAHYPPNTALADWVLITADHDLRTSRDLALVERAAEAVARVPGVHTVRAVTRPLGEPIPQASLGHQVGVAGQRLGSGADQAGRGVAAARRLDQGAGQVSAGASRLASGADQAVAGASTLMAGATRLEAGVDRLADGLRSASTGTARLRGGARALADGLEAGIAQAQVAVDGLGLAYDALATKSLTCGVDPACRQARDGIRRIYLAERDQLLPGLRQAVTAARAIADGTVSLDAGLAHLQAGLDRAAAGTSALRAGTARFGDRLGALASGADELATGSRRVQDGTSRMGSALGDVRDGMQDASSFLTSTSRATRGSSSGGFYLPPAAMQDERFALARGLFVSRDGRTARMMVLGSTDASGREAMARTPALREAAAGALAGTRLADSDVTVAGMAAVNADIARLSAADFRLVAGVALAVVLLILLVLLRSVVAALFLLFTVVLSYAAAMGLAVLVWQLLLDRPLDWTVGAIAFVLLVAVGADYNMLLIKRVRDEAPDGAADGIARALAATGRVITAAGAIFAASMFALMSGSVVTLAQIGFTIGMGLLLDTFIVRTLVVPAFAALAGPRLWWPSRPVPVASVEAACGFPERARTGS